MSYSTMRVFTRGWKRKVSLIALASGLVLFLYATLPLRSAPFREAGSFWNGVADTRGIGESNRIIHTVFHGHETAFINTTNTSALLIPNAINKTPHRLYNVSERPDKQVSAVSFDVCKGARFVKPRSYPLIALASVPGSGNTWVRYLLERASGFYTGSVYRDKKLYDGGFKGELSSHSRRKTIIVKIHDTGSSASTNSFKGAVVIIRNPYDTLLAYANLVNAGHTGWAPDQYFNSEKWDAFVESASISWENRITTWVTRSNVMVVFFEHLKTDLRHQVARVLEFLHVPINQTRLDCMEAHAEGSFHREKGEKHHTFDPYTDKHKAIIQKHIDAASKVLRETGHIDYDLAYPGLTKLK